MYRFVQTLEANASRLTLGDINAAANKLQPSNPDGGEFVGVLPESLQRLWTFISILEDELKTKVDHIDFKVLVGSTEEKIKALDTELRVSMEEIENLRAFFKITVHSELGIRNIDDFSIHEGWTAYYTNPFCEGHGYRHPRNRSGISIQIIDGSNLFRDFKDHV